MTISKFNSLFLFAFCFLLFFSVYRFLHDAEFLTYKSFMDNLLLLDYDFSTTIEQFKKIDSLFKSIESAAGSFNFTSDNFFEYVKMFVTQLGKMFQALYNILLLPFYIIYDAYVFLRSIFDILCFYIGFTFPFYG